MRYLFLSFSVFSSYYACAQLKTAKDLLLEMHNKYAYKYCKSIRFDQKTIFFDSTGNIKDTSIWHEWIRYPDKFRIDYGGKYGENMVVFRNDSMFYYRNYKIVKAKKDENDLLLLLGGMYFRPYEEVLKRLDGAGYDMNNLSSIEERGKKYFLISSKEQNKKYRILVDKATLRVESITTNFGGANWFEMQFDKFVKSCDGYNETKVTIYKNNKLEQKEEYFNIKTNIEIPDSVYKRN